MIMASNPGSVPSVSWEGAGRGLMLIAHERFPGPFDIIVAAICIRGYNIFYSDIQVAD